VAESLLRLTYSAADAAAATAAVRSVLGSAEVSMHGAALSWQQSSIVDDGISVSRVVVHGDHVRITVGRATELLVVRMRAGAVALQQGHDSTQLRGDDLGLVPIDAHAILHTSGAELELYAIPPAPLARLLSVPKHAVQLHAPRVRPRSLELAAYLGRVADLLTSSVFGVPEVYTRDMVRTHTIDTLTAVVVEAFELTNRSEDATDRDIAVLRRAIAELRQHLADPVSIPEIATAAGVSVRGLQLIFERQLGVSPLLHLRALRLEAAREALLGAPVSGTTVAEIARRFGYSNAGRFSTHYRDAYGESPAASIQRVRRRPHRSSGASEADVVQGSGIDD
jgi:AraC-like DNA-binding protein